MTKILEIINLPSSAKNFIGGQFKYLHEKGGFEMHLICSPGDNIEDFASQNNIHYYPVNLSRQLSPWRDLKSLCCIVRYLRRNKIDMVIAHQAKARLLAYRRGENDGGNRLSVRQLRQPKRICRKGNTVL